MGVSAFLGSRALWEQGWVCLAYCWLPGAWWRVGVFSHEVWKHYPVVHLCLGWRPSLAREQGEGMFHFAWTVLVTHSLSRCNYPLSLLLRSLCGGQTVVWQGSCSVLEWQTHSKAILENNKPQATADHRFELLFQSFNYELEHMMQKKWSCYNRFK